MQKLRFHILALPHTQVTEEYYSCAYTAKTHGFVRMMTSIGHEVYLYAGEETTSNPTELITCISEEQRAEAVGNNHFTSTSFDNTLPHWQIFNGNAIKEISKRIQPKDFICIIGGLAQKPVADAFPENISVEYGIGYSGVFSNYKVFESNTWRSAVYSQWKNAASVDIQFMDQVINPYFDPNMFSMQLEKKDYYVYLGRLTQRKGIDIASQVCEHLGVELILGGTGDYRPKYGTYIGNVKAEDRAALLGGALGAFSPTLYLEPGCNSHLEALACGTPVLTTDLGIFTETVKNGFNGYRANTFAEFINAAEQVKTLDYRAIATDAYKNYSMDMIRWQYDRYFRRLLNLFDDGWYQLPTDNSQEIVTQS
jgi:glycosyltransferase involved in cell wall biosynthesis